MDLTPAHPFWGKFGKNTEGVRVKLYIPRALLSQEELQQAIAHDKAMLKERRLREPEAVRAQQRAKCARRLARDREGFMATRKAQVLRRKERAATASGSPKGDVLK